MKIIVGLGNNGKRYRTTRHNAGVIMLRSLAKHWGAPFKNHGGIAEVAHYEKDADVWCIFPTQLMNNSGPALVQTLKSLKLSPAPKDILVLHDELDLPLGTTKLSFARSSAGHNGVESVMEALGERIFWRLRIGIRADEKIADRKKYVLERMDENEKKKLSKTTERVREGVELWLNDPQEAAKLLNTKA